VQRWHAALGDRLLVIPNVSVEALGLLHAHVFVEQPQDYLLFPWAVEAAWVTPDFCQEVLYLHCVVPLEHMTAFTDRAHRLGETVHIRWTSSGWQQFLAADEEFSLPVAAPAQLQRDLFSRHPFLVPAMMELWQYPNSLPLAWHRAQQRLGEHLSAWFPRFKEHSVNGKTHLTQSFALLQERHLVLQQIVRCHPLLGASVEVFLQLRLDRPSVLAVLSVLRPVLHAVESYPMSEGYWCRLLGARSLLDAIITLPQNIRERCTSVYFHTKRHPSPTVRFAYESLFDPATRTWRAV
jgi:hypothetical protein